MNEMVERVARAIYEARNGRGARAFTSLPKSHRDPYTSDARAAIEAMRDPTEEMRAPEDVASSWRGCPTCVGLRDGWRQMIDAALSSPLPGRSALDRRQG